LVRQERNAIGITMVGAAEGIAASSIGFGIVQLGIQFILCDQKSANANVRKKLCESLPHGLPSKIIRGGWTAYDNHH
jgi:hypothetical protein